jgi:DNA repair protein RadA/Sms
VVSAVASSVDVVSRSTTKTTTRFRCAECGWETAKWVGRCAECRSWGAVTEESRARSSGVATVPAMPIGEVSADASAFRRSGVPELDRVLGGGLVPGAVVLLTGEPGVGKSTLLLEVAAQTARRYRRVLYLTGEESAAQVRLRADRTGAIQDELYLAAETDLDAALAHIDQVRPELLVVDSVQTMTASGVDGVPGGVSQVKEVATALIRVAKLRGITTVLIGHVTKDGQVAGPRALEHLVDVALSFEGDAQSRLRMVRAMKNRYGPADEVGCFELSAAGIVAISDPAELFLESHRHRSPGSCVAITMEGRRPLPAEVQALVTPATTDRPRRTTSGLDSSRVALVIAVLQQHCGLRLHGHDVFASTVGGARLADPAVDLAVALAIASAHLGVVPPAGLAVIGEVGLSGEVRRARELDPRLAEAIRLGFSTLMVPGEDQADSGDARLIGAGSLAEAVRLLRSWPATTAPAGLSSVVDAVT